MNKRHNHDYLVTLSSHAHKFRSHTIYDPSLFVHNAGDITYSARSLFDSKSLSIPPSRSWIEMWILSFDTHRKKRNESHVTLPHIA